MFQNIKKMFMFKMFKNIQRCLKCSKMFKMSKITVFRDTIMVSGE